MMQRTVPALALALLASAAPAQDLYDVDTIRTIEVTLQQDWRTVMARNYSSKTYIKATIKVDGKTYKDVGVRHRGFSTYRFLPRGRTDKRPWKIALDEFVQGQRIQGYRTLNINNNVWDPSFMREVLGYEYMRRYVAAPRCCFVRLKVNGEDLGLFVNTQQINKDFLQEWFRDDEGNRYRGERTGRVPWSNTALIWLGASQAPYRAAYELKTENGPHAPWTKLIQAINVLNNTAASRLPAELPKVLDVDGALRFLAVGNITAWLDSYLGRVCHNFYMYEDPHHGQVTFQPWDLNNGFGGLTDGLGTTGVARLDPFYRENDRQNPRPLLTKIVQRPEWRARYLAHYRHMLQELDWAKLGPRIDALRKFIRPILTADTKRIYTMQQFDQNLTSTVNVGFVRVPGLQPFFQSRRAFLVAHPEIRKTAPALMALRRTPAAPSSKDSVWINATVSGVRAKTVALHYRTRGPFLETPMFDDGKHGDGKAGDGIYGARIPPQTALRRVEYYVSAASDLTSSGAMSLLPPTGELRPHGYRVTGAPPAGPIIISELLAKNDNGIRDEKGERDDWIELTNRGTQPVAVSGLHLTDDVSEPTKWKIPAGHTLQPGQTLLVWADGEPTQGTLHAPFKLSSSGEEVALYDASGKTNLDWIGFGTQVADVSTGRLPGFSDALVTFPAPTPRALNRATPCGHLAYGAPDPLARKLVLAGSGTPGIGATVTYAVSQAPPSAPGLLLLGPAPISAAVPGLGPLLVHPLGMLLLPGLRTDATGSASVPIRLPQLAGLRGTTLYVQSFVHNGRTGGLSNAVATRICP